MSLCACAYVYMSVRGAGGGQKWSCVCVLCVGPVCVVFVCVVVWGGVYKRCCGVCTGVVSEYGGTVRVRACTCVHVIARVCARVFVCIIHRSHGNPLAANGKEGLSSYAPDIPHMSHYFLLRDCLAVQRFLE